MSEADPGTADPLVRLDGVTKHFDTSSGLFGGFEMNFGGGGPPVRYDPDVVRAVEDVSFDVQRGETLGLVGESGCGKSTLARLILQLLEPTAGSVSFDGEDLASLDRESLRNRRRDIQLMFQDPQSSLDPRMRVGEIVAEPMKAHGMFDADKRRERVAELLDSVGLEPQYRDRYPHEFSGGQRQRINLARALSVDPEFIVLDEPTSALDVTIQAQILNTMAELQAEFDLTYLFISHDLSVIRHISDRVAVMYLGEVVEIGPKERVFEDPQHPYTEALLSSIPVPDPRNRGERTTLQGDVPSPIDPPSGCRFRTRCPAMIAPETYDLSSAEWAGVRSLLRAVERREFTETDPAAVRATYFDGSLSDSDAESTVARALELVAESSWERATELLTESFADRSPCARHDPALVARSSGSDRRVACHLHEPSGASDAPRESATHRPRPN